MAACFIFTTWFLGEELGDGCHGLLLDDRLDCHFLLGPQAVHPILHGVLQAVGATMGKVPRRMASICTKPHGSHLEGSRVKSHPASKA
eukprot:Skav229877  [mRNA]  locus=scaffold247:227782:228460:- [translate_table: standard]